MFKEKNMHDHLWPDPDGEEPGETKRRLALEYQRDLKHQMEEKKKKKDTIDTSLVRRSLPAPSLEYKESFTQRSNYNDHSLIPAARETRETQNFARSSFEPSQISKISSGTQFAESLRAQIDATKRGTSIGEVNIPPLSNVSPNIGSSFSSGARFDESKFEFRPSETRSWKNAHGEGNHIIPVKMSSISGIREMCNTKISSNLSIVNNTLRSSKVATPQSGFTIRARSGLAETWGSRDFAATFPNRL